MGEVQEESPMNSSPDGPCREPGLNEKRCIVRHSLKFYHGLVVAGIYHVKGSNSDLHKASDGELLDRFAHPLSTCIQEHPILSTLVEGEDTETPRFRFASEIVVEKHVKVLRAKRFTEPATTTGSELGDEDILIQRGLEYMMNDEFEDVNTTPPWRVYLLHLPDNQITKDMNKSQPQTQRLLIAFTFSHSHGDGSSGLAFHRTFLNSLENSIPASPRSSTVVPAPEKPLPPAIDWPNRLPISWTYLMKTLLNEFVPKALLSRLNIFSSSQPESTTREKSWIGKPCFFTGKLVQTAIYHFSIPSETLQKTLTNCRKHETKLTSVLHQLIVNALCKQLQEQGIPTTHLTTATPIDLRQAHGTPPNTMGVMASSVQIKLQPIDIPTSSASNDDTTTTSTATTTTSSTTTTHNATPTYDPFWTTARKNTTILSHASSTLADQPIGLLRYLSSLRSWHTDKLGKPRETTYELSNVMTFNGRSNHPDHEPGVHIEKMVYVQSADVTGHVMSFNVVSVKGGDLAVGVSWQVGALGFHDGSAAQTGQSGHDELRMELVERAFVTRVAEGIQRGFGALS